MRRGGFTLIELLVVMVIIAILTGLTFAGANALKATAAKSRTASLVRGMATAVSTYRSTTVAVPQPDGRLVSRRLWDFNGDGAIDGDPALDQGFDSPDREAAARAAYPGFAALAPMTIPAAHLDAQRRVVDAWRRPIRITYAAEIYGVEGFGIWSCGPDGVAASSDDIRSWSTANAKP